MGGSTREFGEHHGQGTAKRIRLSSAGEAERYKSNVGKGSRRGFDGVSAAEGSSPHPVGDRDRQTRGRAPPGAEGSVTSTRGGVSAAAFGGYESYSSHSPASAAASHAAARSAWHSVDVSSVGAGSEGA
jgi:hypothetical protein